MPEGNLHTNMDLTALYTKKLFVKGEFIGYFTTLRIDNSKLAITRNKEVSLPAEVAYHWHDMVTESAVM